MRKLGRWWWHVVVVVVINRVGVAVLRGCGWRSGLGWRRRAGRPCWYVVEVVALVGGSEGGRCSVGDGQFVRCLRRRGFAERFPPARLL